MATVSITGAPDTNINYKVVQWVGLAAAGDVGAPFKDVDFQDRSVQVAGTFNASTVVFEGSNDPTAGSNPGGATWTTLSDPLGNALSFTAAGLKQLTECALWVRPRQSVGTGATITVTLLARGDFR